MIQNVRSTWWRPLLASCAMVAAGAHAEAPASADNPFAAIGPGGAWRSDESRWDIYLSGYAYHDRDTYSKNQLRKLNETTWGGGLGRTLRNARGNDESLYVIGIRDSNDRPQWMAGYAYQWVFPVLSEKVDIGVGVTGLVIRRHDWHGGRPFPALLPVASLGMSKAQLVATYVPRVSTHKTTGNVVLLMLKLSL